jgi:phosphoribosylformylglycinamidine synthase II
VVYVGSKTGRDGIHGATMASAEFDDQAEAKRPTVQVGDPFTEKLLIEACLELMETDCIVGIQDMGAAGLTSSSFEMASKGNMGVELDLDCVPMREENMSAYEIMLSESQERMLMVLKPGREDIARAIFEKWELDFAIIGQLTDSGRMVLKRHGEIVADLPIAPLADAAPMYDRPWVPTKPPAIVAADEVPCDDPMTALAKLMGSPDLASKRWIWQQYDHMVMGDTVQRPGGDAAIVRIHDPDKGITNRGLAMVTDCTPRYCLADPVSGGRQAVAEAWRNLTAVGARPLAITDNMNFGNPEKPEIMGQFVQCIEGMRDACLKLDFPVVSGNVSLYNETNGKAILPTPAIGAIGLIDDLSRTARIAFEAPGDSVIVIGATFGHLGASQYLRVVAGREDGAPPAVDLAAERRNGDFVRGLIQNGQVTAVHDVSDGGILVALAEMALAGNMGAAIVPPEAVVGKAVPLHAWLFGEDQGRYIIATKDAAAVLEAAKAAKVPAWRIGATATGPSPDPTLTVAGAGTISLSELREAHEGWLPGYMAAGE